MVLLQQVKASILLWNYSYKFQVVNVEEPTNVMSSWENVIECIFEVRMEKIFVSNNNIEKIT